MAQICLTLIIVAVLTVSHGVNAKRGCSAFGHSCFGGHGKRSGDTGIIGASNAEMLSRQLGQEETPPHPGYPHSVYNGLLPPGNDIIPIRDGGNGVELYSVYEREDNGPAREVMRYKLRNIVKHWVDSFRRSQQNDDAGYFLETL